MVLHEAIWAANKAWQELIEDAQNKREELTTPTQAHMRTESCLKCDRDYTYMDTGNGEWLPLRTCPKCRGGYKLFKAVT